MEKAWAKFTGSYEMLAGKGGWSQEPLRFFTAAPTYTVNTVPASGKTNSAVTDWTLINKYNGTSFIMLAATPGLTTGQDPDHTAIGLLRFHVYNILATYSVICANKTTI